MMLQNKIRYFEVAVHKSWKNDQHQFNCFQHW